MGEALVLILCDSENDLGQLICKELAWMSDLRLDLRLDLATDLKDLQQKLSLQDYSCVVIDAEAVGGGIDSSLLQDLNKVSDPPLLYIINDREDADRLSLGHDSGLIDFLLTPINGTLLKNRIQFFLELDKEKKRVIFYREEFEAKSLELEVRHQELLEKNCQLELLSSLDNLTGLFNRYYFDENLQKEWRQAVRQSESLSLLFINVDLLKPYNEHYGRSSGDELLRELAGALHGTLLRPVDIVARYGGDQFAAILPGTDKSGAELVATRMLENVDALKKEHLGSPDSGQVSISIGGATMHPELVDKPVELMEKADSALLEAKRAGRNRVFHK
ncbi:diguanylate cyclase [Desulforhopalus sp. 52FAK]